MTLDPELERLIASARGADLPDDARVARVRDRLLDRIGVVEAGAASSTVRSTSTAASGVGAIAVKTVAVLSALALVGWAAQHLLQRDPIAPPAAPQAPVMPVTQLPVPSIDSAQPSVPAPPPAAIVAPPAARAAKRRHDPARAAIDEPADRAKSFAEEVSLLQRVIAAQQAGRHSEARALIAEHRRRYPDGQLRVERERLAAQLRSSGAR